MPIPTTLWRSGCGRASDPAGVSSGVRARRARHARRQSGRSARAGRLAPVEGEAAVGAAPGDRLRHHPGRRMEPIHRTALGVRADRHLIKVRADRDRARRQRAVHGRRGVGRRRAGRRRTGRRGRWRRRAPGEVAEQGEDETDRTQAGDAGPAGSDPGNSGKWPTRCAAHRARLPRPPDRRRADRRPSGARAPSLRAPATGRAPSRYENQPPAA